VACTKILWHALRFCGTRPRHDGCVQRYWRAGCRTGTSAGCLSAWVCLLVCMGVFACLHGCVCLSAWVCLLVCMVVLVACAWVNGDAKTWWKVCAWVNCDAKTWWKACAAPGSACQSMCTPRQTVQPAAVLIKVCRAQFEAMHLAMFGSFQPRAPSSLTYLGSSFKVIIISHCMVQQPQGCKTNAQLVPCMRCSLHQWHNPARACIPLAAAVTAAAASGPGACPGLASSAAQRALAGAQHAEPAAQPRGGGCSAVWKSGL